MPTKVSTLCYIYDCSKCITKEFIVKEVIVIVKTNDNDSTKIIFLKIKIFLPIDKNAVSAISVKITDLDFDCMPATGINVIITDLTTQTVKNVDGQSVLNFYIKKKIGKREPSDFWIEVRHSANNKYLSNRMNSVNQNGHSTNALLVGTINYHEPIINNTTNNEITPGKHILTLENMTIIMANYTTTNNTQTINILWLLQSNNFIHASIAIRSTQQTTQKASQRKCTTLSRMGATATQRSQSLQEALEANKIPRTTCQENSEINNQNN
ncbi:20954_t:CDS:2 [Gigaspora margarita]|uniref:20954_t:CDS:1 n=1 Tax=Gigaspora margarita TaxID=4874 RepID=A0ABN7W0T2_GIGMA|nr:20954_t:CDS:2 [Gigaspora margarita]